jgi:hypothetical protein
MAFPQVAGTATTNGSTAATDKVCNLPSGIASGNLLLLVLRSAAADTHTTPSGWTALFANETDASGGDITSCWYRVASGTEGTTVTVNGTASTKFASLAYRIAAHDSTTPPAVSTRATGTSTTPNPPALTPGGGAQDYLWLWMGGWQGEQTSPPAGTPTNYTDPIGASSGTAGSTSTNCRVASARRTLTAASEDPPAWTISVSDVWRAWTVAVFPAQPTRGRVAWVELEAPLLPTRGRVSWTELEAPLAPTRGRIAWAELEAPLDPTRGRLSWTELEVPSQPTRGRVAWAELEAPDVGGMVSFSLYPFHRVRKRRDP